MPPLLLGGGEDCIHYCAVYSLLHTLYSLRHIVFITTYIVFITTQYSLLHTVYSLLHTVYSLLHSVFGTTQCIHYYTVYSLLHTLLNTGGGEDAGKWQEAKWGQQKVRVVTCALLHSVLITTHITMSRSWGEQKVRAVTCNDNVLLTCLLACC